MSERALRVGGNSFAGPDDSDERLVLGAFLAYPAETIEMLGAALDPELFHSWPCKTIFAALVRLTAGGVPISVFTLTDALRKSGDLENVGGPYEVTRLFSEFSCAPTVAEYHLGRMRDHAAMRLGLEAGAWLSEQSQKWGMSDPSEIVAGMMERIERIQALRDAGQASAVSIGSLVPPSPDDGRELLRTRFLCRSGGMLLVGPTGVGKSSLGFQAATSWALGRSCFGVTPAQPLRSLIIQAENDGGDMAEMRDGVFAGLDLSAQECRTAGDMIHTFQENSRSGEEFFRLTVEPLLRLHKPDLLWIDPALSYIAGESNSQADVGRFLRNWLNPLLSKYRCGAIVVHHTNKPPSGREKAEWSGSDLAYLGSGSAEWANWARAVVAIRSLGENGVYNLCLGKRGGRVGWRDETGEPIYSTLIGHSKEAGRIFWRTADEAELTGASGGAARRFTVDHIVEHVADEMRTAALQRLVCSETGMSRANFYSLLQEGEKTGRIHKDKISQCWVVQMVQNQSN